MTENNPTPPAPKTSAARKLGIGAALIAVPVGTVAVVSYVKQESDAQDHRLEQGAAYELGSLKRIDPSLIKYKQVGQILTGIASPRAMVVSAQGNILVGGDGVVRSFSPTGQRLGDIAIKGEAYCLASSPDGRIFVGFKDHVEIFNPDGSQKAAWPTFGSAAYLTSIAVSGEDIYVADAGRRIVYRCDVDGKVQTELGKADPSRNIPGIIAPSPHLDVAVASDGQVWITNPGRHRLESYTRDGELNRYFGSAGSTVEQFLGCCNPSDFTLLSDGRIVTAEKGVPRVKVYLSDGRLESVVVGPEAFGDNQTGLDLAVDKNDRVLVLEPGAKVIRVFERNG